jgi:hypothetical protein
LRRQTESARGVFTIGDAEIDVILIAYERDTALQGFAAGRSDDVPDQEQGKCASYLRADAFAFF